VAAKIISSDNLQTWINKLTATCEVYAPSQGKEVSLFKQVKEGDKPALNILTDIPPKGLIFKQVEKIFSYRKNEDGIEIKQAEIEPGRRVIFGIRPCDARSFTLTDKVFVHSDMPETHYAKRRQQTALITLACNDACRTCFCTSVGGSPAEKVGDVWMMDFGGRYLVEALTPVGEEIIRANDDLFSKSSPEDEAESLRIAERVASKMPVLEIASAKLLDELFTNEEFWVRLSEKCLSCGACTFLCPTCYCFDVRDQGSANSGDRYRGWDSCMFYQYNRAAGGHNPREQHWKRMRQRMLHKFSYFVTQYGNIDCVGCGRCIRSCPVSYDLRDFLATSAVAVAGVDMDFVGELPSEGQPRTCDIK